MSIEWDKLREFDGSVPNAFEELCAQVARIQSVGAGWSFTRNGKPDAGLECFARMSSGGLVGWQAKWYTASPSDKQWNEIESSFMSALANYADLNTFVVCLPLDRSNARGKRKLAMDKWIAATTKWVQYANRQGKNVTFEFLGTSEIFETLSKRDQAGRLRFWFGRESFDAGWFRKRFEESWANNRRRYRPELDVAINSEEWTGALCQTREYMDQIKEVAGAVAGRLRALTEWAKVKPLKEVVAAFTGAGKDLEHLLAGLPQSGEGELPHARMREVWRHVSDIMQQPVRVGSVGDKSDRQKAWEYARYQLEEALHEWSQFTHGVGPCINMGRAVLLLGDAGQGKTHTLFRLADDRTRRGEPVVVLCGVQFTKGDPWSQMVACLGLTCDRDEFLGALNAAGEAMRTRALIVVDALNESDDPGIWRRSLAGMIEAVRNYPFLGLALSMRGEFAEAVLPETLTEKVIPTIMHRGFAGRQAAATTRVFEHFGIRVPEVPMLDPEFTNPLFVLTLAEGLQRAGLDTLPRTAHSLRWVFNLWLDGVNRKLALPAELDFDVNEQRVQAAADALAREMYTRGSKWLPANEARALVDGVHQSASWSKSLFKALVSEDVVQRLQVFDHKRGDISDRVRFTFDRFADHHIVRALLSRYTSPAALRDAFVPVDEHAPKPTGLRLDSGLLRSLAIELPEDARFHCELNAVLQHEFVNTQVTQAIVESVHWRSVESIGPEVVNLIRDDWRQERGKAMAAQSAYIERLVQLATRSGHPLNADFVDAELRAERMAERDYWWSRPLTTLGGEEGTVMRLIDWLHSANGRTLDDETARLAIVILSWFFATSNRFVRDRATKAVVAVLSQRPRLARVLVDRFLAIDDVYIVERVLAAAYGAALRTTDSEALRELATTVHTRCFAGSELPVHLSARGYAQGIVDAAARRELVPAEWAEQARPPYKSDWPAEISLRDDWRDLRKGDFNANRGLRDVEHSIFDDDFSHYVIGKGHHEWLRYPLNEPLPTELTNPKRLRNSAEDWAVVEADRASAEAQGRQEHPPPFYAAPGGPLPPHTAPSGRPLTPSEIEWSAWFPSEQTRCMVMDEVVRLGYSSRLDEGVQSTGRGGEYASRWGTKSERIGKKYQWIAYWTTQARIADNFRFAGHSTIPADGRYEGTWQISRARDIDPTCLLRRMAGDGRWTDKPTWWAPFRDTDFDRVCDDRTWLMDTHRVPTLEQICGITEPATSRRWIVGWAFVTLNREKPKGIVPDEWRRRSIWYNIETVLVRKEHADRLVHWLNHERRAGSNNGHRLMPERPTLVECFLREFPQSQAWTAEEDPYYCRDNWRVHSRKGPPVECSLVADGYFEDGERDGSRDEVLQFTLPSAELVREMGLRHAEQDGHFVGPDGRLAAWDPSITQEGPMALLLDAEMMAALAKRKRYRLVTLVHGEQRVMNEGIGSDEYLGQLLFSGVFTYDGTKWFGGADARFDPPS